MRRAANDVRDIVYRSSNRWVWKKQNLVLEILPFPLLSTGGDYSKIMKDRQKEAIIAYFQA